MKYDLHIHTQESDGKLSKIDAMREANQKGIDIIAFTDHNTCKNFDKDVLKEQYIKKYGEDTKVQIITGVEIDAGNYGGLHILGYGIKDTDSLDEILEEVNNTNEEIAEKVIDNLVNLQNVDITSDEVRKINKDGKVTKRSTIDVLMQKGYANSPDEACKLYVGKGAPSYIKRRELLYQDVIPLIKMCGGVPVLAHPGKLKTNDGKELTLEENIDLIMDMKKYGLEGIECLTTKHTPEQVDMYNTIVNELDLIATAGTDYHNSARGDEIGLDTEPERYLSGLIDKLSEEIDMDDTIIINDDIIEDEFEK